MRTNGAFLFVAIALFPSACTDNQPPTAPTSVAGGVRATPQYQLFAAASGGWKRGTEDDILRLENFLPGLGGIYVEGKNIVVLMPATASREEVLAKLALGAVTLNLDPTTRGQMVRGENIVLRPSHYAFSQLVAWAADGQEVLIWFPE
jgi:hypothetical protein